MGGDQRQPLWPADRIQVNDLVHRTEGTGKPDAGYSDEYSRVLIENKKKQMDELMLALSRLGVVDQLQPQGMYPRSPYRFPEQEFSF
jgi:hypothetical protein